MYLLHVYFQFFHKLNIIHFRFLHRPKTKPKLYNPSPLNCVFCLLSLHLNLHCASVCLNIVSILICSRTKSMLTSEFNNSTYKFDATSLEVVVQYAAYTCVVWTLCGPVRENGFLSEVRDIL